MKRLNQYLSLLLTSAMLLTLPADLNLRPAAGPAPALAASCLAPQLRAYRTVLEAFILAGAPNLTARAADPDRAKEVALRVALRLFLSAASTIKTACAGQALSESAARLIRRFFGFHAAADAQFINLCLAVAQSLQSGAPGFELFAKQGRITAAAVATFLNTISSEEKYGVYGIDFSLAPERAADFGGLLALNGVAAVCDGFHWAYSDLSSLQPSGQWFVVARREVFERSYLRTYPQEVKILSSAQGAAVSGARSRRGGYREGSWSSSSSNTGSMWGEWWAVKFFQRIVVPLIGFFFAQLLLYQAGPFLRDTLSDLYQTRAVTHEIIRPLVDVFISLVQTVLGFVPPRDHVVFLVLYDIAMNIGAWLRNLQNSIDRFFGSLPFTKMLMFPLSVRTLGDAAAEPFRIQADPTAPILASA